MSLRGGTFSRFIIAEVEGKPAASLCALPASGTRAAVRARSRPRLTAIRADPPDLKAIFRRGAYAANCWVQGGEGDWLIEHVATVPAYRGRGLVQASDRARACGRQGCGLRAGRSISFVIGNEAAERSLFQGGFAFAERSAILHSKR